MEETLHYTLLSVHTLFQKAFLLRLSKVCPGLLPGQPKVIDYLMSHPDSFQREIAEGCLIEPATLCPILEKMERSGLIRRDKADGNRKNSLVALTEEGRKNGKRIRELFRTMEEEALEGIAPEERRRLMRSLSQIREHVRRWMV